MIYVENKDLVIPGQILADDEYYSGRGTFKENGKVCSSLIGLVSLRNKKIRVIPLKSKYVPKKGDVVIGKIKEHWGAIVMPTVGCPCIIRNRSGQLNLMYKFKTDGNFTIADTTQTDLYYKDEGVTYLNSVCKIYFGNGDEYTIDNWKKFNLTNTDEEILDMLSSIEDEMIESIKTRHNNNRKTFICLPHNQ